MAAWPRSEPRPARARARSGCAAIRRSDELVSRDRQRSQTLPRGGEDGIAERGCHRRNAGLPNATGLCIARQDVDVECRRLMEPQHTVIVEITLLYAAAAQRDVAPQRGRKSIDDAALELRFDDARIDGLSAIDDARDLVNLELAILDGHFRHLGDAGRVAFHEGETLIATPDCMAPACTLGDAVEYPQVSRLVGQKLLAQAERILGRQGGDLVDRAFDGEAIRHVTD